MMPPGPILAATDFSTPARHAIERAARLAHETGLPLTLMHVLPGAGLQELRQWLGAGSDTEAQLQAEAAAQMQALADSLLAALHVQARTLLTSGAALDEIAREALALQAGLLVVGARGQAFLRRWVLGSTAERLVRRATQPVLVVRQTPHQPYRRLLLALDFSPWSLPALRAARRVAPHAHCTLLTAFRVPFEDKLRFASVNADTLHHYREQARRRATDQVHTLARRAGLKPGQWQACVVEGEAAPCILEQEQVLDCDLVVLGKHGQTAAEDLLLGSVTKHVLAEAGTDVLVCTASEEGAA